MAESFSLGEAILATSVDTSGLDKGLGDAKKKAKSFGGAGASAGKAGFALSAGMVAASVATVGVAAALALAVGGAKAAVNAFNRVTDSVINMAKAGIAGNTAFEQYEVQFKVMLGSAALAQKRLEELDEFGRKTPFELPGVVEADRILQGFGLHASDAKDKFGFSGEEIRRIAGDVAAGTGVSFTDMTTNLGKFSAGATGIAIQRFQELGIVTRESLGAMGIEFSKSGELLSPMPEAMEALLTIMDEKYGGMMDAQSATLGGMLSNLEDWVGSTLRMVTRPIFEVLKSKVEELLTFLESPQAQGAIQNFTSLLSNLFSMVSSFVDSFNIGPFITRLTGSLSEGIAKLNQFISTLRAAMSGFGAGDVANQVAISISERQSQLSNELTGLAALNATTIAGLQGQIENASVAMEASLGKIAEQFGEQAAAIQERFAEAKIANEKAVHDKIIGFEEKRAEIREQLQEKLADIDKTFADKRTKLLERLRFAETEADILEFEGRLALLDEEETAEEDKAKAEAQAQDDKLTKQHNKELQALADRLQKEEAMRDKQFGKLAAQQAEQEAAVITSYNTQVAALEESIASENEAYAAQSAELTAAAQADMDTIQETGFVTANSLGTNVALAVGKIKAFIQSIKDFAATVGVALEKVKKKLQPIIDFIKDKVGVEAKDVFIALGVVVAILAIPFVALGAVVGLIIANMIFIFGLLVLAVGAVKNVFIGVVDLVTRLLANNEDFINGVFEGITESIGRVGDAIDGVIGFFKDLIDVVFDAIAAIDLFPMMGDSPSPFEVSLVGVGKALHKLSAVELPALSTSLDLVGLDREALLAGNTTTSSSETNFNLQVVTNAPSEPIIDDFRMLQSFQGVG